MGTIRTYIAPVLYRRPTFGASDTSNTSLYQIQKEVKQKDGSVVNEDLYWFDELLDGGLKIPEDADNKERPFLLFLAGPPGTGKSTFALELCYNLARKDKWRSLYISAESTAASIIENVKSFGWNDEYFVDISNYQNTAPCFLYSPELDDRTPPAQFFNGVYLRWHGVISRECNGHSENAPDIMVLDSLNVLNILGEAGAFVTSNALFNRLFEIVGADDIKCIRPRILIIILDGYVNPATANPLEFLADAAFRFEGQVGPEDYFLRTLQIVKIKTQHHAWGKHTFKIYKGKETDLSHPDESRELARPDESPYLGTGGTFVFPSTHWHFSTSIRKKMPRRPAEQGENYPTPLQNLNNILALTNPSGPRGFPAEHTTALVGARGAMKSHLAYYFLLAHTLGMEEGISITPKNTLLISLRDDIEAAKATLGTIVVQQGMRQGMPGQEVSGINIIQELINHDRLEVFYNWPGCITPGEFIHRVYVALHRKRITEVIEIGGKKIDAPERATAEVVVLSGLDHLEAKFPLCAREKVFVPGLVALFRACGVCSVVISANQDGSQSGTTDILPLADLILDFRNDEDEQENLYSQSAIVTALRVPSGQIGRRSGILARNEDGRMDFYMPGS